VHPKGVEVVAQRDSEIEWMFLVVIDHRRCSFLLRFIPEPEISEGQDANGLLRRLDVKQGRSSPQEAGKCQLSIPLVVNLLLFGEFRDSSGVSTFFGKC